MDHLLYWRYKELRLWVGLTAHKPDDSYGRACPLGRLQLLRWLKKSRFGGKKNLIFLYYILVVKVKAL